MVSNTEIKWGWGPFGQARVSYIMRLVLNDQKDTIKIISDRQTIFTGSFGVIGTFAWFGP